MNIHQIELTKGNLIKIFLLEDIPTEDIQKGKKLKIKKKIKNKYIMSCNTEYKIIPTT